MLTTANKLKYILDKYVTASDVRRAFGFKSGSMITNMKNGTAKITTLHMEGLEKHFSIPVQVFSLNTDSFEKLDNNILEYKTQQRKEKEKQHLQAKILKKLEEEQLIPKDILNEDFSEEGKLNLILKKHKEDLIQKFNTKSLYANYSTKVFPENKKLFSKLKGKWYGYVYPSNPNSAKYGVWEVETNIADDYSVVDFWGNKGYLKIGKNESLIIKESYDHEDLTIIRFSNRQIPSQIFRFLIVSNQNHTLNEIVNFGFFSRKQYSHDEAKKLLGKIETKQLKLDLDFNERLIQEAIVPQ